MAARILDALEVAHLCELERARDVLEGARWQVADDLELAADERASLLDEAATFLMLRFCEANPDRYITWRKANGYQFDPDEMSSVLAVQAIEYCGEESVDPDIGGDELFARLWTLGNENGRCAMTIRRIATEPRAMIVAVKMMTWENDTPPVVRRGLPSEVWYGGRAVTAGRRWWSSGRDASDRITRETGVLAASVSIVCEFNDGRRRPVHMRYRWEEDDEPESSGRWIFERLNVNMHAGGNVVLDY